MLLEHMPPEKFLCSHICILASFEKSAELQRCEDESEWALINSYAWQLIRTTASPEDMRRSCNCWMLINSLAFCMNIDKVQNCTFYRIANVYLFKIKYPKFPFKAVYVISGSLSEWIFVFHGWIWNIKISFFPQRNCASNGVSGVKMFLMTVRGDLFWAFSVSLRPLIS